MKLNFRKYGEGEPVIILHGLLGSLDNWATIGRSLGELFKTHIVDLRNHGQSPHSDTMSFSEMAGDVIELMDDEGMGKASLIGHSLGGKVAMQLALGHSERVVKLIVVDIAPRAASGTYDNVFKGLFAVDPSAIQSRDQADAIMAQYLPEVRFRQFLLKNLTRNETGGFRWRMNLEGIFANYAKINLAIKSDHTFDGDVLFVRGKRSNYVTDGDMPHILQLFPKVNLVTVAGAAHWVHADAPEAFQKAVLDFLRSDGKSFIRPGASP